MTITQDIIYYKTKVSHKHMVVIYHRNTPLTKVRKGLDGYNLPFLVIDENTSRDIRKFEFKAYKLYY
jgi:hypothetical protein